MREFGGLGTGGQSNRLKGGGGWVVVVVVVRWW